MKNWFNEIICKIIGHKDILDVKHYVDRTHSYDGESVVCKRCHSKGKISMHTGKRR